MFGAFRKLRLVNFKNLQNVALDIGGLTMLVGTNAAGKSNLRDAFRFVHGISRGYSVADILGEKRAEGSGETLWSGIRGGTKEVSFAGAPNFGISTETDSFSFEISVNVGSSRSAPVVEHESLRFNEQLCYESIGPSRRGSAKGRNLLEVRLVSGDESVQLSSTSPLLMQVINLRGQDAATDVIFTSLSFQTEIQFMRFLDLEPEAMRRPSLPGQNTLGDRGENLSSVLLAICDDNSRKGAILEWIKQLTPMDVHDLDFVPDQIGRVLLTLVESDGQRISAHSASDGTLRFLAMIAALFGPNPSKFFFFEEIDSGIHPTRLHLLLQMIEARIKEEGRQVVATTHSPQLLQFLSDEACESASLVYRLEGEKEGHVCRILDIPDARRVLETRDLGRLLESGWLENAVAFMKPEEVRQ